MNDLMSRIAGAPITWGVDGSPGWGHLMDAERVLSEMHQVGLRATELGPDGYLPTDPDELQAMLDRHHLELIGGFVPAVLHRTEMESAQLSYVERAARTLAGCGSEVLVLGPASHYPGYDKSLEMTEGEWTTFLGNLERVISITGEQGLTTALHQHWGMAIERPHHVERLLAESEVEFCLDTGHLYLGGADPVEIAKAARGRVAHVHLKDVDADMAARVRGGELAFRQAVIDGIFKPLGKGAVDIAGFVSELERSGYQGWYVLEQDLVLDAEPADGKGPIFDAQASFDYLGLMDI
ncbi:MAG: TIM barrel protein [Acidimicrobiia bacterium]|nr:TIM barrel protein [Acidimicrobiia bacterium]